MPIRLIVGVLILKYLYNIGDEKVPSAWENNPYFQYFVAGCFSSANFRAIQAILYIFANGLGKKGLEEFSATV
jgi:IS5 family transposase